MSTYRHPSPSDGDPAAIIARLIERHYPELAEAEVTIEVLFAHASRGDDGEPKGEALKLHGYPCLAIIKANSLQDRVEGKKDCTLKLNGDEWPEMSEEQRVALLDHELAHCVVQRDDEGQIKSDDCGRPKIKMRLHDWQLGGFQEIAARHGEHSCEVTQARRLADEHGQLLFGWMRDDQGQKLKAV